MTRTLAIVDYGSGNLRSAAKAFERAASDNAIDVRVVVTSEAKTIAGADRIVLPGVGAFGDCRRGLGALPGMVATLNDAVIAGGRPFLGICVGMQLMAERGLEHGVHAGLGWIKGDIAPLAPSGASLKIPHMGWNTLSIAARAHPLFAGIADDEPHAYFVHSYALTGAKPREVLATCDYGGAFPAIVGRDNIAGTQFHPEKSQQFGLALLANFLRWRP